METVIEVQNLWHRYPQGQSGEVLRDLSLRVYRGEFLALVGANGSGKSTLARHFNALLLPTRGQVRVLGLDTVRLENHRTIRSQVAMVFQNPEHQLVAPVVEEEVAFGPENLGLEPREIRRRVDAALAQVALTPKAHYPVATLSGGEKQKLAIAGALAMEPQILVLDEATTMLDPGARKDLLQLIHGLNKERGLTVIYITHHLEEITKAHRVLVLGEGSLAMAGPPRDILADPGRLTGLGLGVPAIPWLAAQLAREGLKFSRTPLTIEEMVTELCPLSLTT